MANVIEFTIRGVDKFSGTMGKVSRTLGVATKAAAVTATAVVGAGTAFAAFVNHAANAEDQAGKFAQRLGESVEELTAMQFAADQSGVSVNTLNLAVQRSTRRISEAAIGTGEAKDAIKELGLSAQDLIKLPLEERMAQIADAFSKVENNGDRTRLAFKLFDSEGVAMIQMLEGGSEAMRDMAADARFLGAVISKQAAANAAEFTNETGRLRAALGGLQREIADVFIPVMTTMTRASANALAGMREAAGRAAEVTLRTLVGAWIIAGQVIANVRQQIEDLHTSEGWDNLMDVGIQVFVNIFEIAARTAKDSAKAWISLITLAFKQVLTTAKEAFMIMVDVVSTAAIVAGKSVVLPFVSAFKGVVAIAKQAWKNIVSIFSGEDSKPLGAAFLEEFLKSAQAQSVQIKGELEGLYSRMPSLSEFVFGVFDDSLVKEQRARLKQDIDLFFGNLGNRSAEAGTKLAEGLGVNIDNINAQIDDLLIGMQTTGEVGVRSAESIGAAMQKASEESKKATQETKQISKAALKSALEVASGITDFYSELRLVKDDFLRDFYITIADYHDTLRQTSMDTAKGIITVMETTRKSMEDSFVGLIKGSLTLKEAVGSIFESMVDEILKQLARVAANKLFSGIANIVGSAIGTAFGGPVGGIIGNTLGGLFDNAFGKLFGGIFGGLFHGGISVVPRDGLSMLSSGERVLSRDQNEDFTRMMKGGGMGGGTTIQHASFHFFENATGSDVMLRMSREDWRELVARKIIPAVNDLEKSGVRQLSIERAGE